MCWPGLGRALAGYSICQQCCVSPLPFALPNLGAMTNKLGEARQSTACQTPGQ